MESSTLEEQAWLAWQQHCAGRTASEVTPLVIVSDDEGHRFLWHLNGVPLDEALDSLLPYNPFFQTLDRTRIIVVRTAAGQVSTDDQEGEQVPMRAVTAVSRDGSAFTLTAQDHDLAPTQWTGQHGGEQYALMVAVLIPAGELDRELALITGEAP